jgi:hypothetical protein
MSRGKREEIWSAIRYLDPEASRKKTTSSAIIAFAEVSSIVRLVILFVHAREGECKHPRRSTAVRALGTLCSVPGISEKVPRPITSCSLSEILMIRFTSTTLF